jgi:hypothetical protein
LGDEGLIRRERASYWLEGNDEVVESATLPESRRKGLRCAVITAKEPFSAAKNARSSVAVHFLESHLFGKATNQNRMQAKENIL